MCLSPERDTLGGREQRVDDLSAQIAVVTGAGSGIGKAITASLVNKGGRVCLAGSNMEKLLAASKFADTA